MKSLHLALRGATLVTAFALPRPAMAESHKLLVLQAEGRVDAASRSKIDAAVVKLAKSAEPQTTAGDLTFSDAATAVGCKPDAPGCKDEVLGMLAVDEIVITTVTPKPGGIEVAVHRVTKGTPSLDETVMIASGAPLDKLDALEPLFHPTEPLAPNSLMSPNPLATPITNEPPPTPEPPRRAELSPASPPPARTEPDLTLGASAPHSSQRLELAGMASGGGLIVLSLVLWAAAHNTQGDIDAAPTRTKQDLLTLRDLESRADTQAGLGNIAMIGGVILGGVSTYFYFRGRHAARSTSARLTPTVLGHGPGIAVMLGGSL